VEKRRPHYPLRRLQALIQNINTWTITSSAYAEGVKLGWSEEEIVQCVCGLTQRDFYKSMTAYHNPKLWQDVYRPTFRAVDLYVKLQIFPAEHVMVISFKERRSGEQP